MRFGIVNAARAAAVGGLLTAAGCATWDGGPRGGEVPAVEPPVSAAAETAPGPRACPKELPGDARCLGGRDSAGAYYLIARPRAWNGHLVLHAHGGPALGAPTMARAEEDLVRWAIMVKAGYAWAGSTFAQGGVAVRAAAVDTERLRRIFVQHVAVPRRTILHGQSWGGGVAAKGAEMFTAGRPYDAVLLSAGLLGGGVAGYQFRADLRAVYQAVCRNHPGPGEGDYPVWMGLPPQSAVTRADVAAKARDCLGLGLPAAQRTPEQARRLAAVVGVIRIPESSVLAHLQWATFHFQDISSNRTGGRSVWSNLDTRYAGSSDDAALNATVPRFAADPLAVREFEADTLPGGRIPVPVLQVHAVHDATVFVETAHRFRRIMQAAGRGDGLVQTFTEHGEHSYLSDPVYVALLDALRAWLDSGSKPTADGVAARCEALRATYGGDCRFLPGYEPRPLESRGARRGG